MANGPREPFANLRNTRLVTYLLKTRTRSRNILSSLKKGQSQLLWCSRQLQGQPLKAPQKNQQMLHNGASDARRRSFLLCLIQALIKSPISDRSTRAMKVIRHRLSQKQ